MLNSKMSEITTTTILAHTGISNMKLTEKISIFR